MQLESVLSCQESTYKTTIRAEIRGQTVNSKSVCDFIVSFDKQHFEKEKKTKNKKGIQSVELKPSTSASNSTRA